MSVERPGVRDLAGKVVLVTGAGSGIGAAVAKGFGQCGSHVAVHFCGSVAGAEETVSAVIEGGGHACGFRADLRRPAEIGELVEKVTTRFGRLDILVNNAGGQTRRATLDQFDPAAAEEDWLLNVRAPISMCAAALPHIKAAGGGAIISTGSLVAYQGGSPGGGMYAGAKSFLHNYSRNLARELAQFNIRVNVVAPGLISTRLTQAYIASDALRHQIEQGIPLGRVGTPEDCVGAYLFLASPSLSGYVTGQIIDVNGGMYFR